MIKFLWCLAPCHLLHDHNAVTRLAALSATSLIEKVCDLKGWDWGEGSLQFLTSDVLGEPDRPDYAFIAFSHLFITLVHQDCDETSAWQTANTHWFSSDVEQTGTLSHASAFVPKFRSLKRKYEPNPSRHTSPVAHFWTSMAHGPPSVCLEQLNS